ncbi:MAG TPA: hypothetical protein PKJ33_01685 [Alphaproteobacteria bacterium]|nr:hypothetical protein [Alphaproteobacteria bacterium]
MNKYIPSEIKIIQSVPKTIDNIYGIKLVDSIPVIKTVLFILGGNKAESEKTANNYALRLSYLLKENDINDVNIYSTLYYFNSRNTEFDELNIFQKARRKISTLRECLNHDIKNTMENEPEPLFLNYLYNILIKPRIVGKKSEKIDLEKAIENVRKLVIFTHCYGSTVLKYLENFIGDKMSKIGYSKDDIKKIQENLLIIAHTPLSPLEHSKFTTVSFMSAMDEVLDHKNLFNKYIKNIDQNLKPSFFSGEKGNFFIVKKSKKDEGAEHFTSGIPKKEEHLLTDDGKIIFTAERNALINGLKNSINGGPLPSIRELVSGGDFNFDTTEENGNLFYKNMLYNLRDKKKIK